MSGQRILGIDPGLRITGFGIIEKHGNQLRYVASGCIKSNDKQSLPERIATLFAGISEVIATYRPDQAAVEKVFVNVNPQSTLLLGQARGAAISALVHGGLPVAEYTALQVKQAVVGHGKAAKEQVQHMVSGCCHWPAHRQPMRPMPWPVPLLTPTVGRAWGPWRRPAIAFAAAA